MLISLAALVTVIVCPHTAARAAGRAEPGALAVAWAETGDSGKIRGVTSEPPWPYEGPAVDTGGWTTVRASQGLVYAVSRTPGTVTVVDPADWTKLHEYAVDPACEPEDIAVITPQLAYISCAMGTHLVRFNPETGVAMNAVDLSGFADDDGVPDMGKMALHEGRLFVQVRRIDSVTHAFQAPAMIAVVDVDTEQLIDVDPITEGTQAIELQGTAPKFKMQLIEQTRRLFVSASGEVWDAGGIEMIDLDSLQSLGLIVREDEGEVGADLGAFVLVTPERGYLTFTTDLTLSSHLVPFTVSDGVDSTSSFFTAVDYFVPTLAFDPRSNTLFFPDGGALPHGVYVFDAGTGERLTEIPILTDGQPTDLAIVPGPAAVPAASSWGLVIIALVLMLGPAVLAYRTARCADVTP